MFVKNEKVKQSESVINTQLMKSFQMIKTRTSRGSIARASKEGDPEIIAFTAKGVNAEDWFVMEAMASAVATSVLTAIISD